MRYANGVAGTVVSVGYREGAPKHLTELTCTRGMLTVDYTGGVTVGKNEQWQPVPDSAGEDWMHVALIAEWRGFVDAVRNGTASRRSPARTGGTSWPLFLLPKNRRGCSRKCVVDE